MKLLFKHLEKIPKAVIPAIGALQIILLGGIDHLTGYEISFSIFYLIPVVYVSWFGKRSHALILSVLSAATWMWADLTSGHTYTYFVIPLWNSIMRLGFFILGAYAISEIKRLLEREQIFARVDSLTGAYNSRAFSEIAKIEIDKSVRFDRPFTIAYIDIDNFKEINDMFGHGKGDYLLQSFVNTLKENTRSIDIISRLGGDEFVIFFPETNEENAKTVMNKVQKELINLAKNNDWSVTFSFGVVTCYGSCILEELIKEADFLMYSVKKSGKNRVEYKVKKQ